MSTNITMEFQAFGQKMKIIAILTILTIIPVVGSFLGFIAFIFSLLALTDIKNANFKLNNFQLENYRSKYILAIIFGIIGSIIALVGGFFPLDFSALMSGDMTSIIPSLTTTFVGWIIALIAGILELNAWKSLALFFDQNANLFPAYVAKEASDGANNLKTAALMFILSFLLITILIGWIFQIIGFFKLAKLENIAAHPGSVPTTQPTSTPDIAPAPTSGTTDKVFCSNCGAAVKGAGKFCGECGSALE